eukprot:254132-Pyramimonas_sp.AAC.1
MPRPPPYHVGQRASTLILVLGVEFLHLVVHTTGPFFVIEHQPSKLAFAGGCSRVVRSGKPCTYYAQGGGSWAVQETLVQCGKNGRTCQTET